MHGQSKSYFDITPQKHGFREAIHTLRRKASRFATNLIFGRDKTRENQVLGLHEDQEDGQRELRIRGNRSLPAMRQQVEEEAFLTHDEAQLVPPLPPVPLRHRVTFDDFGRQVETRSFMNTHREESRDNYRGKGKEREM
jgi:hypothetical protein